MRGPYLVALLVVVLSIHAIAFGIASSSSTMSTSWSWASIRKKMGASKWESLSRQNLKVATTVAPSTNINQQQDKEEKKKKKKEEEEQQQQQPPPPQRKFKSESQEAEPAQVKEVEKIGEEQEGDGEEEERVVVPATAISETDVSVVEEEARDTVHMAEQEMEEQQQEEVEASVSTFDVPPPEQQHQHQQLHQHQQQRSQQQEEIAPDVLSPPSQQPIADQHVQADVFDTSPPPKQQELHEEKDEGQHEEHRDVESLRSLEGKPFPAVIDSLPEPQALQQEDEQQQQQQQPHTQEGMEDMPKLPPPSPRKHNPPSSAVTPASHQEQPLQDNNGNIAVAAAAAAAAPHESNPTTSTTPPPPPSGGSDRRRGADREQQQRQRRKINRKPVPRPSHILRVGGSFKEGNKMGNRCYEHGEEGWCAPATHLMLDSNGRLELREGWGEDEEKRWGAKKRLLAFSFARQKRVVEGREGRREGGHELVLSPKGILELRGPSGAWLWRSNVEGEENEEYQAFVSDEGRLVVYLENSIHWKSPA